MNKSEQLKTPIYTALMEYSGKNTIHFDVPGHKKNKQSPVGEAFGETVTSFDANSTKELDFLANPDGIIFDAERLMADAYGCDNAYLLVNGSTLGVLVMVMSFVGPGEKIIMPRNVHKSAINAVILSGGIPVFMSPEIDENFGISNGVTLETVREALEQNSDAEALFIIYPTYFGVACELEEIINLSHSYGIPVIVDQAHGAHLPYHPELPVSATELGADLVTVSMHKTAGSLTQSSVLLHNEGRVTVSRVRSVLNLMQTTSASYLLMASLDITRSHLAVYGEEQYNYMLELCQRTAQRLSAIPGISVLSLANIKSRGVADVDETKLVIKVNELGLTGFEVYDIMFSDYNIQLELGEAYVVLAVSGVGDTEYSMNRLCVAFEDLSRRYYGKAPKFKGDLSGILDKPITVKLPRDAFYGKKESIDINSALGRISGESIMIYPPGIPLIIPGEEVTEKIISAFNFYLEEESRIVKTETEPRLVRVLV